MLITDTQDIRNSLQRTESEILNHLRQAMSSGNHNDTGALSASFNMFNQKDPNTLDILVNYLDYGYCLVNGCNGLDSLIQDTDILQILNTTGIVNDLVAAMIDEILKPLEDNNNVTITTTT
jgi:hypothetical protein